MLRTIMLVSLLTLLLIFVGLLIGGLLGGMIALIVAFILNFSMYWWSDKIVLKMYKTKPSDNISLEKITERLALRMGIPKPKLYIIPQSSPNAFATGRDQKHAVIVVTQGLLEILDDEEIEAVIAHELSHIKNRDMLVATMAATIASAISWLAQIGYWFFLGEKRKNIFAIILIVIFAPLAAMLIKLAISREREYLADERGALLTKKPLVLASALRKISDISKKQNLHGSIATSHLWIINPFKVDWFTKLFSTHPPLEKRILRLESMT